ncbi:DUF881 domain-containing protein [soil metagenome]
MPDENTPDTRSTPVEGRGWKDIVRPSASQIVMSVLIGALAFGMVIQIRGTTSENYANLRQGDLVELIKSLDSANQRVSDQISELTATRNRLLGSTALSKAAQDQLRDELNQLGIIAGTLPATGPGIVVKISDKSGSADAALLLDAIEELRDAGAEVIAVNGVARVVAQTYFLDDADGIRISGREVTRPFVIEAIGEPSTLVSALQFPGGFVDKARDREVDVTLETRSSISITALAESKTPEYAQPTT